MTSDNDHPAHEITLLHRLVADHGGHSVIIVRDGKCLLGWSPSRGHGIALCDLIALVHGATATHVGWQITRKGYTTVDYEHKRSNMGDSYITAGDRDVGFTEKPIYTLK